MESNKQPIQIAGEVELSMGREQVWNAMNDPVVLTYCIKGCSEVVIDETGVFVAVFSVKLGMLTKTVTANLTVEEVSPPNRYRLSSWVEKNKLGDATGQADVDLVELVSHGVSAKTCLRYNAEINVSGWFSILGSRVIQAAATRYMTYFFQRFESFNNNGHG